MIDNQSNLMMYINRCIRRLEDDLPTQERIKILRSVASTANKMADNLALSIKISKFQLDQ